ncbi:MAG: SMC-Scp complex subunit ScpB [Chloroflexi bacterium 44-23]|nr:MAG: SMC-Scp complex subunit ScpB [Chloroflexi bacterium 44-23]
MTENSSTYTNHNLVTSIEAILFASGIPVSSTQLADALKCDIHEIENALLSLEHDLSQGRGIHLQRFGGKVQLTTAPEFSSEIETFLGLEATSRLSRAALETLSIIAYRNPITRPGIDSIRGVNSDGVLKSLLLKGLIEEVGRTEGPGRPILYAVTSLFLQHFGLSSLDDLPELEIEEPIKNNGLLKD